VASRQRISVELDPDVASRLHVQAAQAHVSEGEIVERALRAFDLRSFVARIRSRSDLDEDAAMQLVREELKAARADARHRAE
jgi:predicted transcriptional regulator